MQMLDAVVKDGQEYAASSSEVRADAWRYVPLLIGIVVGAEVLQARSVT